MKEVMRKEERFYNALRDIFIGAKVEGKSGYINLMKIKSRYYEKGVFPKLQKDIESALKPFPEFREELFDKLYTFFSRYFSESGSIYFRHTPIHQNVYEKVYTDDKDVILFWKTHPLYYVKTDRLFRNLEVEIDSFKFFFDASQLEHKKAFEKKEIIYTFKEKRRDGALVFNVSYTERGRKTKIIDLLRALRKQGVKITEDILERAFRIFERQSEVDYFINKNAKEFLREQFNIWLYQYVFSGKSEWTEKRIRQLQILRDIAFKIIDFISQFEDELVKIWNKPKFVLNSNYVITLDRIAEKDRELKLIEKILEHRNFNEQIKEWKELGIVDSSLKIEDILINSPFIKGWQTKGLTGYYKKLPYNPKLKQKARELRKAGNLSEVLLWNELKNKKMLGFDFTRQQVIGNYIVDFHCPKLRLVIEIDGESHDFKGEYDEERKKFLKSLGLNVLHFKDIDVKKSLNEVVELIRNWIKENTPSASQTPLLEKGELNPKYKHLPIDTRYFKDLELKILGLFDDLDNSLDGWLIKSENYQALNTILPKFKEKVQTIYIDPPFNKEKDADYLYNVKYKDSTWASMLENRLRLARDLLNDKGSIFVRCDYNGNWLVRPLMNEIFGGENFLNEIQVNRIVKTGFGANRFPTATDSIFYFSKSSSFLFKGFRKRLKKPKEPWWHDMTSMTAGKKGGKPRVIFGVEMLPHTPGRAWTFGQEKINIMQKEGKIRIRCSICGYLHYKGKWGGCPECGQNKPRVEYLVETDGKEPIDSDWTDIPGYSFRWNFQTENSELLLRRIIESTSNEGDLVMDFFLGSGTTTAVAHKLKRKWIGVEMGEHFWTVVLPRMKKVLAYDKSGISKEKDVKEKYNKNNAGGFFKYYELEQYEDTLRKVKYEDSDLFDNPYQDPYNQYVFMRDLKMLSALEVDYENNKVKVDLSKLYPPTISPLDKGGIKGGIDIAETLSNLLGKWIKKLKVQNSKVKSVVFEDGEEVDIENLDYKRIKPLIWW